MNSAHADSAHAGSAHAGDPDIDHAHRAPEPQAPQLLDLVAHWLDWPACGEALGVPASRVQQLVKEHRLAAAVPAPGTGAQVPAGFVEGGEIVKGVSGVITVLHDGGYSDREIITWLFSADDTIPGRPIDALRENRGSEVKRRAQSMAF